MRASRTISYMGTPRFTLEDLRAFVTECQDVPGDTTVQLKSTPGDPRDPGQDTLSVTFSTNTEE